MYSCFAKDPQWKLGKFNQKNRLICVYRCEFALWDCK